MARLRRPDWLAELQAVLIIGVLIAGVAVALLLADAVRGTPVTLDLPAAHVDAVVNHGLRETAAVDSPQDIRVVIPDPHSGQRLAALLIPLPGPAVVLALLVGLLRIVRDSRRRDPFTRVTVRRLRMLAVVALAAGYGGMLLSTLATFHLSGTVLTDGMSTSMQIPLHWFLVGFGLFAIAEVVRRGCAMREDLETVI